MMIYRCYKKERNECGCSIPCEMFHFEMMNLIHKTTPCQFGEDNCFLESSSKTEFFLLVVGSRSYNDYKTFSDKIDRALSLKKANDIIIVSGGADGVDSMAEKYARAHCYKFLCFPADWSIGKSAGYVRNRQMHEYISKYPNRGVMAFWDGKSKGTEHSFSLAKEYGNQLKVVRI